MAWVVSSIAFALIAIAVAICVFTHKPRFWRRVAKNPDLALSLLANEGCLVGQRPPMDRKDLYAGPFNVRSVGGKTYMVFVPTARKAIIERRVEAMLQTTRPGLAVSIGRIRA